MLIQLYEIGPWGQFLTADYKQKLFLLSKNKQDTSHRWHIWYGILTGNLIPVSITFCALAALINWTYMYVGGLYPKFRVKKPITLQVSDSIMQVI